MKKLYPLFLAIPALLWLSNASADTVATFSTVPVTGCPTCTALDPVGLQADAFGHPYYGSVTGYDVWATSAEHLAVANGIGVDFTPVNGPIDLNQLKLFGLSSHYKTTVPLTYNISFYHPGVSTPDVVPFTINARVVATYDFSTYAQAKNVSKISVTYPATSYIGKTDFIEVHFTQH